MTFAPFAAMSLLAVAIGAQPSPPSDTAKMLFCATGSVGMRPLHPPPGFETEFSVAVVEINSAKEVRNVRVVDFVVFDAADKASVTKRVLSVERFTRRDASTGAYFAYYLNDDAVDQSGPWDGTLPAGDIRLRIRVALVRDPGGDIPGRCRLQVGPYRIGGRVDGRWPT
jgi:hypothetical protein